MKVWIILETECELFWVECELFWNEKFYYFEGGVFFFFFFKSDMSSVISQ